jgi:hypothetical protein
MPAFCISNMPIGTIGVLFLFIFILGFHQLTPHTPPLSLPSSIVGLTDLVVRKRQKRIGVDKDQLFLNS